MEQDRIMNSQGLEKTKETKPPCLQFIITSEEEIKLQKNQVSQRNTHLENTHSLPRFKINEVCVQKGGSMVKAF